ncbi:MAG: MAPEG family protein [Myxococcota bacterium]
MDQSAIFGPFLAMMLLTASVWVFMFAVRIRFLTGNEIDPTDLEVPGRLAEVSPASVSNPSDNLKNLFELPILFYALVLYLFATEQVDALHVYSAWAFVFFRALHSGVHCTFNRVMLRFYIYFIASLALWFMLARAVLGHFG